MELQAQAPVLFLGHGEVITLDDAKGVRIGGRTGTIWVTQEGRFEDDVVTPGDALIVGNGGRTLVQALRPGLITIQQVDAANENFPHELADEYVSLDVVENVRLRANLRGL